jgi:hypothetical protein
MKSIVRDLLAAACAVALLGLFVSSPVCAEDEQAASPSDKAKQVKVIVVRAQAGEDISEKVQKALAEKANELPEDVRAQLKKNLAEVKLAKDARSIRIAVEKAQAEAKAKHAQAFRIAQEKHAEAAEQIAKVRQLIEAKGVKLSEGKAHIVIDTQAKDGQSQKAITIAVAAAVDEKSGKEDMSAKDAAKQITVKIDNGKVLINGKPAGEWTESKQIRLHAQTDVKKHEARIVERRVKPGQPLRVMAVPARVDKAQAEVAQRLKGIESELKKIRLLLEKMQDDDDHEHDGHEHDDDHDHEHDDDHDADDH